MIKHLFLSLIIVSSPIFTLQTALTSDGKVIELQDDGTWKELSSPEKPFMQGPFHSLDRQPGLAYGEERKYVIYYDPLNWFVDQPQTSSGLDVRFTYHDHRACGFSLWAPYKQRSEKELASLVEKNIQSVMTKTKLIKKDTRRVPGGDLFVYVYEGVKNYQPLIWYAGALSSKEGTLQLMVYTPRSFHIDLQKDIESLINGMSLDVPLVQKKAPLKQTSLLPPEFNFLDEKAQE